MGAPKTTKGRELAERHPDLAGEIAAIEAEASMVDDERLARALVRLWPTRHGRNVAGYNARAIATAYNLEPPIDE
jgi:hypothetical protein